MCTLLSTVDECKMQRDSAVMDTCSEMNAVPSQRDTSDSMVRDVEGHSLVSKAREGVDVFGGAQRVPRQNTNDFIITDTAPSSCSRLLRLLHVFSLLH